jgi:hypothetical protein
MVKGLFLVILLNSGLFCVGQKTLSKIEFFGLISPDSVCYGDTLNITLGFKNISTMPIEFYPDAIIHLFRKSEFFVTYDKGKDKHAYVLSPSCNYDCKVVLRPDSSVIKKFQLIVDSNYFFDGGNYLAVSYFFYDQRFKGFCFPFKNTRNTISLRTDYMVIRVFKREKQLIRYNN